MSLQVDAEDHICGKFPDDSVIPDRIVDCVDKQHRIDFIQRPVLPFFNLWQDLSVTSEIMPSEASKP